MNTYARKPISFERGEGVWLYTDSDKDERYLDALSGIAVWIWISLSPVHPGYGNPRELAGGGQVKRKKVLL